MHPHASPRSRRPSLRNLLRLSVALPLLAGSALTLTGCSDDELPKLLVIGHRGASALRPEHTLASYRKAVEDGADVIEPDVVSTKDGVLVARHENDITGTTNVVDDPKFADRKTTKTIDGMSITGWFTEDFTLAELKTLRARERIPDIRPANTHYDDQFEIPTLDEVLQLAEELTAVDRRTVCFTPETKHPTYFQSINLPLEDKLIETLKANKFTKDKAYVFIQSFETTNLKEIRQKIGTSQKKWKLMQLIDSAEKAPYDLVVKGDTRKYADLLTQASIQDIATYADGISPYKLNLINVDSAGAFQTPSDVIRFAHDAGLLVHSWTFRPENNFLPAPLKSGSTPITRHEAGSITEIQTYLEAGLDGLFTDDPAVGRKAVDTFKKP